MGLPGTRTICRDESAEPGHGHRAAAAKVRSDEVQTTVIALQQKNLIRRMGHGSYSITDPFVKQAWVEREAPGANPASAPS